MNTSEQKASSKPSRANKAFSLVVRTITLLIVTWIVVHKLWPSELFDIPLAQLTLGNLLIGLMRLGAALVFGLLGSKALIPPKDEDRDDYWCMGWGEIAGGLLFLMLCPLFVVLLATSPKHAKIQSIAEMILAFEAWLIF